MESIVALSYLVKMGSTRNQSLRLLSKEIMITVEYLLGYHNVEADKQSRSVKDVSKCKGFENKRGIPDKGLIPSRVSHQLLVYMSGKPDTSSRDALQIS